MWDGDCYGYGDGDIGAATDIGCGRQIKDPSRSALNGFVTGTNRHWGRRIHIRHSLAAGDAIPAEVRNLPGARDGEAAGLGIRRGASDGESWRGGAGTGRGGVVKCPGRSAFDSLIAGTCSRSGMRRAGRKTKNKKRSHPPDSVECGMGSAEWRFHNN